MLRDQSSAHGQKIEALICQLDDMENRSRRANIRIRGLPEATVPKDLIPMLQGVFRHILNLPAQPHRSLLDDPESPRDIICKLHKYTLKERIMQKMGKRPVFDFDGAHLSVYQNLFRCTLMQRRALCPLLPVIQAAGLTYRWGFPFILQVSKNGRWAVLRTKDDLPHFLHNLELEPIDFPDWRNIPDISIP